ncbi:hypothetical protein [Pseudarthrobacter oxydans]|nr:hypothetical protein GCM10017547_38800 [Pseudarthrobacter oxydans]
MALSQDDINRVNEEIKANGLYKAFKLVFDILSRPLKNWLDKHFGK